MLRWELFDAFLVRTTWLVAFMNANALFDDASESLRQLLSCFPLWRYRFSEIFIQMAFVKVTHSRSEVNRAGNILRSETSKPADTAWALDVLNNWRASHSYPINTFQVTLRRKLSGLKSRGFVAQRLKRVESIVAKLRRIKGMQLSRMQDIGGLRAVVSTVEDVRFVQDEFVRSRFRHQLVNEKDYISQPKPSGYRSVHLVYRYNSKILSDYNNHSLEIQIRTRLQHSWATAVETVGTFLQQSLKASEGSAHWLDFFAITSAAFAVVEECPPVPDFMTFSFGDLCAEIKRQTESLKVIEKLTTFSAAVQTATESQRSADYYLLVLRPAEGTVTISGFDRRNLEAATRMYLEEEKKVAEAGSQVVLVRAESIDALKKAYPNYFLDTRAFLKDLGDLDRNPANKRERPNSFRLKRLKAHQLLLWPAGESSDEA